MVIIKKRYQVQFLNIKKTHKALTEGVTATAEGVCVGERGENPIAVLGVLPPIKGVSDAL
jgi:hypothetical protein